MTLSQIFSHRPSHLAIKYIIFFVVGNVVWDDEFTASRVLLAIGKEIEGHNMTGEITRLSGFYFSLFSENFRLFFFSYFKGKPPIVPRTPPFV